MRRKDIFKEILKLDEYDKTALARNLVFSVISTEEMSSIGRDINHIFIRADVISWLEDNGCEYDDEDVDAITKMVFENYNYVDLIDPFVGIYYLIHKGEA